MFKKQLPIIFVGLCVVVAVLVLGWSVFVRTEVVAPVQTPVGSNSRIVSDDNMEDDEIILPDLEARNLQFRGRFDPPRVGDRIGCTFDIVNVGKIPVSGTFNADFYYEEMLFSSSTYIEYHLSPNESIMVDTNTGEVLTKSGAVNFSVVLDSTDKIEESNEDNNMAYAITEVLPRKETGLPDLQVKNLEHFGPVYKGDVVHYKFDIFNNGDADFNGDVLMDCTYAKEGGSKDRKQITDLNLAMGESKSIEVVSEETFSKIGNAELSVRADYWNVIRELDESNNREFIIVNVLPVMIKEDGSDISKIDISDWETYWNGRFGLEIKYPRDWFLRSFNDGGIIRSEEWIAFIGSEDIFAYDNASELLEVGIDIKIVFFKNSEELSIEEWASKGTAENAITEESLIDGESAIIRSIILPAESSSEFAENLLPGIEKDVFIDRDGEIYTIGCKIKGKNRTMFEPIFDQVVSTFRFTKGL